MTDVGDAVTLTFTTTTGATVTAETLAPSGATTGPTAVTETPASSGNYPFTFVGTEASMWRVVFRSTSPTAVEPRWVRFNALSDVPPLAVPEDIAGVWRALTAGEETRVTVLIDHASRIVRLRWTDLDARIAAGTLNAALVAQVVARMVTRVMDLPAGTGVKQTSETVGPYSSSTTYDAAMAARSLFLDDDDVALLAPVVTADTSAGARSIRLYPALAQYPPC